MPTSPPRSTARWRSSASSARRRCRSALPNVKLVGARLLRHRAGGGVVEPVALRRRALRPSRGEVRRPHRHVQEVAREGLRRRGEAADPRRHLRASRTATTTRTTCKAQKVRRLIADDFARAYRDVRRHHGSDGAVGRVSDRRQGRRSGADVPERHLHRRRQPDRRARHVDPVRLRPAGLADRRADPGQLLRRGEAAESSRTGSSRRPTGTRVRRREHGNEVGSGHRPGDARPAVHRLEDLLRRVDGVRRGAEQRGLRRRHRAAGRAAGAEPRRRRARDPLRPGRRRHRQPPQRVRAQELLLPGPAEGLPDPQFEIPVVAGGSVGIVSPTRGNVHVRPDARPPGRGRRQVAARGFRTA